jgi:diguanylate cyclase (GGDEF)-like protein/PAS domain S-box-containing protein
MSTAFPSVRDIAKPARPWKRAHRFAFLGVASIAFWLVQLLLVLGHGRDGPLPSLESGAFLAMAGVSLALTIASLALPVLGTPQRHGAALGIGAAAGIGLAGAHIVTAVELDPFFGLVSIPFLVSGLVAGCLGGAGAAWLSTVLGGTIGRMMAVLSAVCGFAAAHVLTIGALNGLGLDGIEVLAATIVVFALLAGAGVGMILDDTGIVSFAGGQARADRFQVLAEALPIPLVLIAADDPRVIFSNQRFRQQFHVQEDTAGTSLAALFVHREDSRRLLDLIRNSGVVENQEVEVWRADGAIMWTLVAARTLIFDGAPTILLGLYDISDRKAAEEALLASEVRYALISRAANDGIWDWDIPSGTVYYSARWKEIVGIEAGKRINSIDDWLLRVHPEDADRLQREIEDHIAGRSPQLDTEYRIRHGSGHYYWMQCRAIAMRNGEGKPIRMAGSQSDITLRKTYEISLLNAAYEDRLTGIKNRAFFTQLVDIRNNGAAIWGSAIVLINIDQFRRINDGFGTVAGDALLGAVVRHLSAHVGPQDALARLGGDEFAIWLHEVRDHLAARDVAETMLAEIIHIYSLGDAEVPVTASIGIAAPTLGDAASGADLLRNARLALDHAKQQGGARVELFDDALLRETNLRRRLGRELAHAERLGQIYLEYQPLVELVPDGSNRVIGFEALMRWRHPELGQIPPIRFIPLAEESGLIGSLGLFAIESAAKTLKEWKEAGIIDADCTVSVNLSPRQVSDPNGVARLLATIDRLDLPPGQLKLEVTESVLMTDPDAMVETLEALRRRGVLMLLDDFGTGYSSLSYLHRFPFYALKIDRSFVNRMSAAPEAFRLVRSIIELGHDLGLRVVAEGVEAMDEVESLRDLGCDYAQGYFFSRPVSAELAADIIAKRIIEGAGVHEPAGDDAYRSTRGLG